MKKTKIDYIDDSIVHLAKPVKQCELDPDNRRIHPEPNKKAVWYMLDRYKQIYPLVGKTQPNGKIRIYAGNERLIQSIEHGREYVAVIVKDDWTEEQCREFALADNRVGEMGRWDEVKLAESLQSFPDDFLNALQFETQDGDADGMSPPPFVEVDESIVTEHTCPRCGYKWSGGNGEATVHNSDDEGD